MSLDPSFSRLVDYPGTRFYPEHHLLTWHPRGILEAAKVEYFAHWLGVLEPELGTFHRFVDLSLITGIHLTSAEVARVADIRATRYKGESVLSVFLAGAPLSFGVASIYQRLMADTPIRIEVVMSREAAARLLQVEPGILEPPEM